MPLYFFDLEDALGLVRDAEGRELPDLAAASEEAARQARPIMAEELRQAGRLDLTGAIRVRSEEAEVLYLSFHAIVDIIYPDGTSPE